MLVKLEAIPMHLTDYTDIPLKYPTLFAQFIRGLRYRDEDFSNEKYSLFLINPTRWMLDVLEN